jgi:Yip1 domain
LISALAVEEGFWDHWQAPLPGVEGPVNSLLNYFVDLCLLRAKPQDLPSSSVLLMLTLLANVLVGMLVVAGTQMGPALALEESLFEVMLMLLVLHAALRWYSRPGRFPQTATAILGSGALISLLAMPLLSVGRVEGELGGLLLLLLVVWNTVVLGHILRHAFEVPLGQAVALSVIYTLASYVVIGALFPVA